MVTDCLSGVQARAHGYPPGTQLPAALLDRLSTCRGHRMKPIIEPITVAQETLNTYNVRHDRFDFESELGWEGSNDKVGAAHPPTHLPTHSHPPTHYPTHLLEPASLPAQLGRRLTCNERRSVHSGGWSTLHPPTHTPTRTPTHTPTRQVLAIMQNSDYFVPPTQSNAQGVPQARGYRYIESRNGRPVRLVWWSALEFARPRAMENQSMR